MTRRLGIITSLMSSLALILSIISLVSGMKSAKQELAADAEVPAEVQSLESELPAEVEIPTDVQYVLYLGTNDKDTNEPVFAPEEAKEKAQDILLDHFGGYTIQEANGGWVDDGKVYREYTLVIC